MSLEKLGSASAIIAALRAEVSRRSERAAGKSPGHEESAALAAPPRDVKVLRRQLADIAQAIPLDDLQAVRQARPRIIRAILLWEFGASLRDHPDWQAMLESVTATLERHPPHEAQFLELLTELKRSPPSG